MKEVEDGACLKSIALIMEMNKKRQLRNVLYYKTQAYRSKIPCLVQVH